MQRAPNSAKFLQLQATLGTELLDFFEAPNVSADSGLAHAADGTVAVFATTAPLDKTMIPKEFFSVTALFRIAETNDAACQAASKTTRAAEQLAALQTNAAGPSLTATHFKNCLPEMLGKDKRAWEPSLGARGFYAISKEQVSRFVANHYLAVHCTHDILSQELHNYVSQKIDAHPATPYTIGEFSRSKQLHAARLLSLRNVKAVAARVADALGLKLLGTEIDNKALPSLALSGAAAGVSVKFPLVGVPFGLTYFNHLSEGVYAGGGPTSTTASKPAIAVYCECGNPAQGFGSPVIPLNPIEGMLWVKDVDSSSLRQPTFNSHSIQSTMPCGTGHQAGKPAGTVAADRSFQLYVDNCISLPVNSALAPLSHPKIVRNYNTSAEVKAQIGSALPHAHLTTLEHVVTVVR